MVFGVVKLGVVWLDMMCGDIWLDVMFPVMCLCDVSCGVTGSDVWVGVLGCDVWFDEAGCDEECSMGECGVVWLGFIFLLQYCRRGGERGG